MANCSVLEAHQKPTDKPTKRIKRSGGHSLVNQHRAKWIKRNILLQMMPVSPVPDPHSSTRQLEANSLKSTPNTRCRIPYLQHHIEPKLYKVNRRQMEELERWYASVSGDSL